MLERIVKFSINNKLIIGMMTLVLIVWGIWSAFKLPVDALPDITDNQVQIITVCPTLASQEVEQLVTFPIEQSIANIPGLKETRSISRFGLSVITAVFEDNMDIYFARQLINENIKEAAEDIPEGVGHPEMAPVSTGLGEVYQYILHPIKGSEDKYSAMDLRTMQDWIVARQLYGTPGVAEVNGFGGELKQYEVAVNPNRLKAMGVSIIDIFDALESNNRNTGGAYIDKKPNAYFIRGIGVATSLEDIEKIAIKSDVSQVPVLIKDVAEVRYGSAIRYGALTYDGQKEAVGGVVMMLKGANSNDVVKQIKKKIETIQKSLPDDIMIEPYLDRTELVDRAISTVEKNLIFGALIVIFVLVVFLGNMRSGLIVASAIPLSFLFALGMMRLFGVSANLMSLGAVDFGLIVDGAVIIVEASMHYLAARGIGKTFTRKEIEKTVEASAVRMMSPAAFGQIIILIVYIPILTLTGIEGKMFKPMAMTVSFAIIGALILSLTYIPVMCALFLPKTISEKENFSDRMMRKIREMYEPVLETAIRFKGWLVAGTLALLVLTVLFFGKLGSQFIPQLQEGDFAFHCILPQGSSLSQSVETSMKVSRIIKEFDEVELVVGKTGSAEIPTDPMPPETTDLIIVLKPKKEWKVKKSYEDLAEEILEKLEVIPGVFFEANQPIQMRFNELMTGIRQDVAVKIFGENLDTLKIYGDKVGKILNGIKGVQTPQIEQIEGLPQIDVTYDRTRLANYGLTVADANDVLSTAFAGKIAGRIYENERRFDLVVRLDDTFRTDITDVKNMMMPTHSGNQIPMSQVADVSFKLGPAQISREDGKRRIVVGFNVSGQDIQGVVETIQKELNDKIKLPTGYYFDYGGQFENLQEASQRLLIAVPIALFLIFVMLYFTFKSLKEALLVFTAIPMSAIGGVFALLIRGMPFSISAGVGFIALFGVAVLNGVVLIDTFNHLEKEGVSDVLKRVREGTLSRLRPVLMTATVASLGFLPMAISTSAGAEVQRPLATVVMGGLVTATFLTLIVLPLLYIIFNSKMRLKAKPVSVVIFGALMLSGISVHAQRVPVSSMEEAVEIALQNNIGLQAKDLEIRSTEMLKKTSGELPKTELGMEFGHYDGPEFNHAFEISQSIPFPTVFGAKKRFYSEQIKEKEFEKELGISELKYAVRYWYNEYRFLKEEEKQLQYLDSLYSDFIRVAELRHRVGEIKKTELSTAKVKRSEVHLKAEETHTDLMKALRHLRVLLNLDDLPNIIDPQEFGAVFYEDLPNPDLTEQHPSVQALRQESRISETGKKLERALALPDISVGYTNQSLIGYHSINNQEIYYGSDKRFSYFNVGISIPLAFGTRARVKSLEYQRQSAQAAADQKQKELTVELVNLIQQGGYDASRLNYYRDEAIPTAKEIESAALLGYQTGDIDYIEYLFSLQIAADLRLNYLKAIRDYNRTYFKIYALTNQ